MRLGSRREASRATAARAWRHEQLSVAMALEAASHHSAQQNAAPRELNTSTRGGARVGRYGDRSLLHRRSGRHLCERVTGPQRSERTVRRSAGGELLLGVAPLAAAADDGVDAATLAFLTRRALVAVVEREKRKEKKVKAEAK